MAFDLVDLDSTGVYGLPPGRGEGPAYSCRPPAAPGLPGQGCAGALSRTPEGLGLDAAIPALQPGRNE
jgi:hypothetical protein